MLKRPFRSEEGTSLAQKSIQILQTLQPFFRERSPEMMGAPASVWSGQATPSSTSASSMRRWAPFPTRATVPLLIYNTAAVVLAATNSFVWNR